jgi:hypothetical protein
VRSYEIRCHELLIRTVEEKKQMNKCRRTLPVRRLLVSGSVGIWTGMSVCRCRRGSERTCLSGIITSARRVVM